MGGGGGGGEESDDATENGEGTVLPPIGGIKGKRDSKIKTQTFKNAGNATLQKPTMAATTVHGTMQVRGGGVGHHFNTLSCATGAGAIGTSTSMSSGDQMSSTIHTVGL